MVQLVPWEAKGWETSSLVSPIKREGLGSPSSPLCALKSEAQSCPLHHPWCCPASEEGSGSASSELWKTDTPGAGTLFRYRHKGNESSRNSELWCQLYNGKGLLNALWVSSVKGFSPAPKSQQV